jgi:transcriptional regulator with XRE-family HTH domain
MQYYAAAMQRNTTAKLVELREHRQEKGLSQAELANKLGISQSTVSRRERTPPQRHSDATLVLCNYAVKATVTRQKTNHRAILKSFDEVCKKSDAHAAALSKIIEAFVDLCKAERKGEESG